MAAYVVMVLAFLLNSRIHIKDLLKRTFLESAASTTIDDADEALPYRWAVLGTIFSFLLLAGLCVYAGMSLWVACSIITLFLIASTALTWMVVNGGMLLIQAPMYPVEYFEIIAGSRIINANSFALLGFQRVMMRDWGGILMPSVLHGLKAADPVRLSRRSILGAMALAIVVAIVVSYAASLPLIYDKGGLNLQRGPFIGSPRYFNHMVSLIQYPKDPKLGEAYSMILGAGITGFLLIMQRQFMWWQLHPIGYVSRLVFEVFGTQIRRYRILSQISTTLYGINYRRVWHRRVLDGTWDVYRCELPRRITGIIFLTSSKPIMVKSSGYTEMVGSGH